ncbi:probetacellulin [Denticeps clupeoides]|uniref:EGF-like domain-containing protein n=1 Tax=Denticeps clupeoides TaxID=299321 RepID=A0AAY4CQL3_9TELE|nr:pro-neuregulin-4, membrane-bound isoform [Denticeps clupeoides]
MMTGHGVLCEESESSYCMNGGTCFKINSVSTPSCVCSEEYSGSRCEHLQLLMTFSQLSGDTGLVIAITIVSLLILAVLIVVIYCTYKVWKSKRQSQNPEGEHLRNKTRV